MLIRNILESRGNLHTLTQDLASFQGGAPSDAEALSWAVEATKRGAFNFLRKGPQFDGQKLLTDVKNALEHKEQNEENSNLRKALESGKYAFVKGEESEGIRGTPPYVAPEVLRGSRPDRRADLYALGCVLYEMLAGEPPYTGPTPQAVIARRLSESAPPVRRARPAVRRPGLQAGAV